MPTRILNFSNGEVEEARDRNENISTINLKFVII